MRQVSGGQLSNSNRNCRSVVGDRSVVGSCQTATGSVGQWWETGQWWAAVEQQREV